MGPRGCPAAGTGPLPPRAESPGFSGMTSSSRALTTLRASSSNSTSSTRPGRSARPKRMRQKLGRISTASPASASTNELLRAYSSPAWTTSRAPSSVCTAAELGGAGGRPVGPVAQAMEARMAPGKRNRGTMRNRIGGICPW
uniref:Uncharacterized protein n=1 Tax=Myxococcus xanthus TaxID=34 RepID=O30613_MYXXA|nr:unknown [Myxococcus xanthus DK 1622]